MTGWRWLNRWVVAAAAVLGVVSALVSSLPLALRVLGAIGLTLFAPGYALAEVLWPEATLARAERMLVTAAGSLALLVLVSVAVAALSVGLTSGSISVSLFIVTIGLLAVAEIRGRSRSHSVRERSRDAGVQWRRLDVVGVTVAVAVAVAALAIGHAGASRADSATAFSEFYFQPATSGNGTVVVGVRSFERQPMTFRLVVTAAGQPKPLLSVAALNLTDGQAAQQTIVVPAGVRRTTVRAVLYQEGSDTVYREISLAD